MPKPKTAAAKTRKRRPSWQRKGLSRAQRVIRFIQGLPITAGMHAGRRFKLRPWQRQIIEAIYATDADGRRTKRQVLITFPRKNGKTQLAAGLAAAHLWGPEAESRGQCYSAAADRQQAALIFRELEAFILADAELSARCNVQRFAKKIEVLSGPGAGSTYEALSSDARKAHGLSPSFIVADELAQWKSRDLYDNLITGTGGRDQPLFCVISTKSHDPNHVMSELVRYGERVRDGLIEDPSFLPIIFAAPDDADPWDEAVWFACNPALGDFRSLEEMRTAAAQAKRLPAREPAFRLLYLNQPVDVQARFLNAADWRACEAKTDITTLRGKRCILGLDLSSTTDLTALSAYFPDSNDLLVWFWAPAENLEEAERRDHVPYRLWARQGLLETTPGRAIDKSFVVHRLGEIVADFAVQACAYDRWRIDEVRRLLADEGIRLEMVEFGQGWKDMGPAVDSVETLILQGELRQPGHPILDMCVANAVTVSDPTGARKLVKDRSTGRIDGLVAAAMAIGLATRTPPARPSVYSTRGIISLSR